ncbi:hypothetical protein HGH92_26690 [Chitinophaga varians]|uniref:DUF4252 domain-containing protein n=1 Tax=Chitinophaga varians TaxID=2202339 RepID=A0A847S899_9BACT|nr:hypothetical protein [Chitinophaga varians]NLR67921.1 hypothetical protein [Chitinophaga varians]
MKTIFSLLITVMTTIVSFSCSAQDAGNISISFQLPAGFKPASAKEYKTLLKKHLSEPTEYTAGQNIYYHNDKGIGMIIREMEPGRFDPASLTARKQMYDALKLDEYSSVIEVYNGSKFMVVKYTKGSNYYTEIASDLKQDKYAIVVLECNQTMSEEVSSIVNSIKKTIRLK